MQVDPYLFFDGKCEEALNFYRDALGAKVESLMRFKEHPDSLESGMVPKDAGEKIMHAAFRVGDNLVMASDGQCKGHASFQGFSLALTAPDATEAERLFGLLSASGQVQMPLSETFFSPRFGMVADRFGVTWMVLAAA